LRQEFLRHARGLEHFVRPSPLRDVQHQRSGRVGYVDGELAAEQHRT
jgi:hypothetical protein